MNSLINKKVPIISKSEDKTIFDCEYKFEIPIYQRGYEWEEEHIDKLINDVLNNEDNNYYLGILVISKNKKNNYDIIDGQQRITTLYLILKCLGKSVNNLSFAYRENSRKFLENIDNLIKKMDEDKKILEKEKIDSNMYEKLLYIHKRLSEKEVHKNLLEKLATTYIIVTELDSNVDLNHYFEIMNVRGEQLLQSDIVKSKLMKYLNVNRKNVKDTKIFSEIWEACSDINSYVQMNFKPEIRKKIFGINWNSFKPNNYEEIKDMVGDMSEFQPLSYSIKQIIKNENKKQTFEIDSENEETISIYNDYKDSQRFTSIIEFKYFLLHVLKVFVDIHTKSDEKVSLDELIVEKKTTSSFDTVFEDEFYKLDFKSKSEAAKEYIYIMLKSRFLFDNYMIKRELIGDTDSKWSLKYGLKQKNKDGIYFKDRFETKKILMLQSLLRVTYTNPRQMHWITETLIYLNRNYNDEYINENKYLIAIQNYIRKEIQDLDFYRNKDYYQGFDTHHILFNYLDFLLWKTKNEYEDFSFEYRNSVEHFYPRNPDINKWDEKNENGKKLVDSYGNLCLITTSLNSHFSNLQPSEKKYHCSQDNNKNISLKLREMFKYIDEKESNEEWKKVNWEKHQNEMLNLLISDVEKYKKD